jgi:transcription elongation factor GreA
MKEAILKQLTDELERLKHELHVELPEEIGRARELGDLSENAEYHSAKERQLYVRARLEQLQERISQLSIMDFSRIPRDKIGLGSTVKLRDLDSDEQITYQLVIAEYADVKEGRISVSSPIGRSLINKVSGDEVEVSVPSGIREFEILGFTTLYDTIADGNKN